MLVDPKLEAMLYWLGPSAARRLPVIVLQNSSFPSCFLRVLPVRLLLLHWLLDDVNRIFELIDVEEHGLDAKEAIKGDLVHN